MLQQTALRLEGLGRRARRSIVCNEAHRFLVAEQLRQLKVTARAAILLEPFGRNTAPAIALAAHAALKGWQPTRRRGPAAARAAGRPRDPRRTGLPAGGARWPLALAEDGQLVTFGIVAHAPETGYGYIQRGARERRAHIAIARFVEKPDAATRARSSSRSGEYYWNSGMFVFRARRYLAGARRASRPRSRAVCARRPSRRAKRISISRASTRRRSRNAAADSIDYAVMEKTADAVVVPLDAGWSDVGSWASLHEALRADADGNVAPRRCARARIRTAAICYSDEPPGGRGRAATITWWSRPRTRCWSRPRSACRT